MKVIDDEIPENKSREWIKNNDRAISKIMEYLANSHLNYVRGENLNAKNVFKKLDDVYDRRSLITQVQIMGRLHNFKMQDKTPLKDHFKHFGNLSSELI